MVMNMNRENGKTNWMKNRENERLRAFDMIIRPFTNCVSVLFLLTDYTGMSCMTKAFAHGDRIF
jgi:hypothetical protein